MDGIMNGTTNGRTNGDLRKAHEIKTEDLRKKAVSGGGITAKGVDNMRIQITQGDGWYSDKVGEVYEVDGRHERFPAYYVKGTEHDGVNPFVIDGDYVMITAHHDAQPDAINSPNHYTNGRFETIEIIEEITQGYDDGFTATCVGNALKYLARAPYKHGNPAEDLRKAAKYIEFALEHEGKTKGGR